MASNVPAKAEPWLPLPRSWRLLAAKSPGAVLLETAKRDTREDESLLFLRPEAELVAWKAAEVAPLLAAAEAALREGKYVAGVFRYECGEQFLGLPMTDEPAVEPLAWLGVFGEPMRFRHGEEKGAQVGSAPDSTFLCSQPFEISDTDSAVLQNVHLEIGFEEYAQRFGRVQDYLRMGHSYQVNLTDRISGTFTGSPLAVYEMLLEQQPVPFAAFVNRPNQPLISCSPELFFRLRDGVVTVRPMKGTWVRGVDAAEEGRNTERLRDDPKNRSEHVTIVDLLRNDVGRVAQPGTVMTEPLFAVEPYRTLLQMTSTICGHLRNGVSPTAVFRALFPCGSITGAPKRRTAEIIREVERVPRGVYTGAIGYFGPHGESCFNVAIRTLVLGMTADGAGQFVMGVGGGVTLDSSAAEEYAECELKASFIMSPQPRFALLETMRAEDGGVPLLANHLSRLGASAQFFGFPYAPEDLGKIAVGTAARCGEGVHRLRLTLDERGAAEITSTPLNPAPWAGRLRLSSRSTSAGDVFLHHKTTRRALYDGELAAAIRDGFDEVLFLNTSGELTEGAISNVFLLCAGQWRTPALRCGVLPGVARARLLQTLPEAAEAVLTAADLRGAERVVVCNALRGTRVVECVELASGITWWQAGRK